MQEAENDTCEEEVVCIQPAVNDLSGSGSGSTGYDYETDVFIDDQLQTSHPSLPDSGAENGTTTLQDFINVTSTCESDKELFLGIGHPWIPHCSCDGFYTPVQCWHNVDGQFECWCSTAALGHIVGGSRRVITCKDPSKV